MVVGVRVLWGLTVVRPIVGVLGRLRHVAFISVAGNQDRLVRRAGRVPGAMVVRVRVCRGVDVRWPPASVLDELMQRGTDTHQSGQGQTED